MDNTQAQLRVAALQRHLQTGNSGTPLLETSPTAAGGVVRRLCTDLRVCLLALVVFAWTAAHERSHSALGQTQGLADSPDDVVIVSALRTPMTKAKKGGLRDTPAETLLATLIKETLTRTRVDPAAVGDFVVGSVLGSNVWRANQVRLAAFLGGLPESVSEMPLGNAPPRNSCGGSSECRRAELLPLRRFPSAPSTASAPAACRPAQTLPPESRCGCGACFQRGHETNRKLGL